MLTKDDGTHDGQKRYHLNDENKYRPFDPDLYDGLTYLLKGGASPAVSLLESTNLLPRAEYFSEIVPDKKPERLLWRKNLLQKAIGKDLVFFDPDNGREVASKPMGKRDSSKYVSVEEVKGAWDLGCSILIYQHLPRKTKEDVAKESIKALELITGSTSIQVFDASQVLYFLVSQNRHKIDFRKAIETNLPKWKGEIAL